MAPPAAEAEEQAWRFFVACTIASAACGVSYAFSGFSGALKAQWALTQGDLETISIAGSLAVGALGGALGTIVDSTAPAYSLAGGGAVVSLAYFVFWAIATRTLSIGRLAPVPLLGGVVAAASMGGSVMMTSVIALIVRSLPASKRGLFIGLAKAYVGMSAGGTALLFEAATAVKLGASRAEELRFPLAIACEVLVISVLPAMVLPRKRLHELAPHAWGPQPHAQARLLNRRLAIMCLAMAAMLVTLAAGAFCPRDGSRARSGALEALACAYVCFWFAPALLTLRPSVVRSLAAWWSGRPVFASERKWPLLGVDDEQKQQQPPPLGLEEETKRVEAVPASATLCQMVQSAQCWLIALAVAVLLGAGMMVTVNMGQILSSSGLARLTASGIACFSIGSSLGRALGGPAVDGLRTKAWLVAGVEPAICGLIADCVVMVCAHALLQLGGAGSPGAMLAGVVFAGGAFGATWPHLVLVVVDCFGPEHLGAKYGFFDGLCQAVGSLILAKFLPSYVYARRAAGDELECVGSGCFRDTHRTIQFLCTVAMAALCVAAKLRRGVASNVLPLGVPIVGAH